VRIYERDAVPLFFEQSFQLSYHACRLRQGVNEPLSEEPYDCGMNGRANEGSNETALCSHPEYGLLGFGFKNIAELPNVAVSGFILDLLRLAQSSKTRWRRERVL